MTDSGLLLVEDDEVFRAVLTSAMHKRGFEVIPHASLTSAMQAIPGLALRYAVLDLNLNGESALGLIPALCRHHADIRILVLTGYASIATAVQAIKLGAREYMTKPVDADRIAQVLRGDTAPCPDTPIRHQPLSFKRLEWEHLQRVLAETGGNISETARRLGLHRRTLQRKLQKRPVRY